MIIEGKFIVLRDMTVADLAAYSEWLKPGHRWQDFDGPYYRDTEQSVRERYERRKSTVDSGVWTDPRNSMVIADARTSLLIGEVNSYWRSKETNWLCAGLDIFDESHWGKGIGAEALGLWTQYLFSARKEIVRLGLETWSGNIGMIRLALKLGFIEEARFRKARIVHGQYYDAVGFGILREEWQQRPLRE